VNGQWLAANRLTPAAYLLLVDLLSSFSFLLELLFDELPAFLLLLLLLCVLLLLAPAADDLELLDDEALVVPSDFEELLPEAEGVALFDASDFVV